MKTEYHLEIYEPDDNGCVAASWTSPAPFMAISVGDVIHGGCLNLSSSHKSLRVTLISHIVWEIENSHIAHKVCLYTELFQQ